MPKLFSGQGLSGRALLRGEAPPEWKESLYYRYWDHGGHNVCAHYGVRTPTHKLIYFHPPDTTWDGIMEADPRLSPYWELFDAVRRRAAPLKILTDLVEDINSVDA